jgi:hypothetical protein
MIRFFEPDISIGEFIAACAVESVKAKAKKPSVKQPSELERYRRAAADVEQIVQKSKEKNP